MTTVASPPPPTSRANADLIRATEFLDRREAAEVRRRAIFDCCKWDPQVGDVATLAPLAAACVVATKIGTGTVYLEPFHPVAILPKWLHSTLGVGDQEASPWNPYCLQTER